MLQAARLREILTTLGPAFVKIGQVWHAHATASRLFCMARATRGACISSRMWVSVCHQAVSSRPDVAPPSFVLELEKLQDQIPPFPNAQAMAVVAEDLGVPPAAMFSYLSPEPVAAASLGQARALHLHVFDGAPFGRPTLLSPVVHVSSRWRALACTEGSVLPTLSGAGVGCCRQAR